VKRLTPKAWITLGILLLFLGSAIFGVSQRPSTRHFSSPHEIRLTESRRNWDPTFAPPSGSIPAKPYRFGTSTSSLTETEIRIESQIQNATGGAVPHIRVIDAGLGKEGSFGPDLTIRLKALSVFWPDKESLTGDDKRFPAKFIDPHTHDPVENWDDQKSYGTPSFYLSSRTHWPEVMFLVETSNDDAFRWMGFRILNAENQTSLSSGSSYHHAKLSQMSTRFEAWHNPPFVLAIDFAYGPAERRMLKLEPGATASFSQAEIRLHELHTGKWSQSSRSGDNDSVTQTLTRRDPESEGHLGLLNYAPKEFGTQLQVRLPDGSSPFVHAYQGFAYWTSRNPLPNEEIEFLFLPNRGRILFHLPPLPGGPNNGAPVDNLFDLRIPYLEAEPNYQLLELIRKSTDLTANLSGWTSYSSGTGDPEVFEDATIAELLDYYVAGVGMGRVKVDQQQHKIVNTTPLWERIKKWLGF
tara:strand:+ start:3170 stop:4573 length:1404 start_codon:yes stop_codon:yes gene_type:complete